MNSLIIIYDEPFNIPSGVRTVVHQYLECNSGKYHTKLINLRSFKSLEFFYPTKKRSWLLRTFFMKSKSLRRIAKISLAVRKIKDHNPDVVSIHNGGWPGSIDTAILAGVLAIVYKLPINYVLHNYPYYPSSFARILAYVLSFILKHPRILLSSVSKDCSSHLSLVFSKYVYTVNNGFGDASLSKTNSSKINHDNLIKILFVGELAERKGLELIADIASTLTLQGDAIPYFILAGSGDIDLAERIRLQKQGRSKFSYLGNIPDPAFVMSECDVLLVPSLAFESFGMVVLEAYKYNIPVICSGIGGLGEIVINNKTGFIVSSCDAKEWCDMITFIHENPDYTNLIKKQASDFYHKNFLAEHMVSNYEQLFDKFLKK